MKLIGINGLKGSGKDTTYECVKALVEAFTEPTEADLTGRAERRAFADNLKIMAALALGYAGDDETLIASMNLLKEKGSVGSWLDDSAGLDGCLNITGRRYLQEFGNRAREVFGDTFWVDQVAPLNSGSFREVWGTLGRKGPKVGYPAVGCVTDVRYPNEAERIQKCGGTVWEVIRPGLESDGHASEKPLPRELVDEQIVNDRTHDDLMRTVAATIHRTTGWRV